MCTLRRRFQNRLRVINATCRYRKSEDIENTAKVEVHAFLTSTGRQNLLLEQIVSRLSLEPGVTGVSWEIIAEHD